MIGNNILRNCCALGIAVLALTHINVPAYAQYVDWGRMSALLAPAMTEQEVIQKLGYTPNKVELHTCGQNSSHGAWTCKKYTYGNLYNNLTIYFQEAGQYWVVNGWDVYP
jgi:hypothetical protein